MAQAKEVLLVVLFVIGAKSQEKGSIFDFARWRNMNSRYKCSVKKEKRQANINVRNPTAKKKQFYNH